MSPSTADGEELLRLALSVPEHAELRAASLISTSRDPSVLSVAHQARGLVLRDRGELGPALVELRSALRLSRRSGEQDREADVRASLGAALTMSGRTQAGLAQLELAVRIATDRTTLAKVLMRRGYVQTLILDRHAAAFADLERALPGIRAARDRVWEARTLNLMGVAKLALGKVSAAAGLVRDAEEIFASEGQQLEAVQTQQMRGLIAYCRGDLPTALALYNSAADRFAALGPTPPLLALDQADAMLTAGLMADARDILADQLSRPALQPIRRAELLLALASTEFATGRTETSLHYARDARDLFRRQRREEWMLRAELAVLRARGRHGDRGRQLVAGASDVARRLEAHRSDEAPAAWLIAGRLAAASGDPGARDLLARAGRATRHSSNMVRATGWLARAIEGDLRDDTRAVLHACRRGLDAVDEQRRTFGSAELRASSTVHGDELARLATRRASRVSSRSLLWWSERWRANALIQPPVRPPEDPELVAALAALRDNGRRLAEARLSHAPTAGLEAARTKLEQSVRQFHHQLPGLPGADDGAFDLDRLIEKLGDRAFVELVNVDNRLHAVVVANRTVRRYPLGDADRALALVESVRFGLRHAARGRPAPLGTLPDRLQAALLGDAARAMPDGPVIISPTSRLHAVPWSILPALRDVPVSTVPSAALWLRAERVQPRTGPPVFIAGPAMESGGAEVTTLAARRPGARVLRDGTATVDGCLSALENASVAHIAAHGHFRIDSPLFSTLEVDDGALTVHDFGRLDHAPHRLVLSACESGVMAPVGSGELLGFAAALLSLGTVGVVSSVVVVNDRAAADFSLQIHRWLGEIDDLPEVMLRARIAARGDLALEAAGAAFIAMGR